MIFFTVLFLLAIIIHAIYTIYKITKQLHMMQLNSYHNERYLKWLNQHVLQAFSLRDLIPIVAIVPRFFISTKPAFSISIISGWLLVYCLLFFTQKREKSKKPLVFTSRAKRLLATNTILLAIVYILSAIFIFKINLCIVLLCLTLLNFCVPLLMIISNLFIAPIETYINHWYYQDANKKLAKFPQLKIIGITGSFGKTTTKYILNEILKQQYNVLFTPGSFNTTMGVIKIIRNQLKPIHEIFIVEMGAKQPGDIKEICDLVRPQYGILTAIGPQHLDTFVNIKTIKKTKNELIESLPQDGIAFFNMDNEHCRELSKLTNKKIVGFSVQTNSTTTSQVDCDSRESENPANINANDSQIWIPAYAKMASKVFIQNAQINGLGSTFNVCTSNNNCETFETQLLGEHNLSNIAGAIAIGLELGIKLKDMKRAIKQLKPVLHRLNLKRIQQNIIIIDDAFNSNPIGSKMALDVLAKIPGDQKIIVTPGLVDLGAKNDHYNKKFGENISKICDYVILVGPKQTKFIQEGLKIAHFPEEKYFVAKNLETATKHLWKIVKPNAVVLFENDLPDNYTE